MGHDKGDFSLFLEGGGNYENRARLLVWSRKKDLEKSPAKKVGSEVWYFGFFTASCFDLNVVEGNIKRLLKIGVVLIRIVFTTIKI